MLNLLPKNQKKKISREYLVRFFVVGFALIFIAQIISLILLIPPYLTAETRIELLNVQSAGFKAQNVTAEITRLSDIVRQTNNYLSLFTSSTTPNGVVPVIKKVVEVRDGLVKINNLSYKNQNGKQLIVVGGVADSRQNLLDYVKKLKVQPGVVSADLPVSDFVQSKNINFSVTVVMKAQNI